MSSAFNSEMNVAQTAWRTRHVHTKEHGSQNGRRRAWILPRNRWKEELWPGIRSESPHSLPAYIDEHGIQKHLGVHNLKSSWVQCANLYFAHRRDPRLLASFLADRIDSRIVDIWRLELEWAEDHSLDPTTLLGEPKGNEAPIRHRRTSPSSWD